MLCGLFDLFSSSAFKQHSSSAHSFLLLFPLTLTIAPVYHVTNSISLSTSALKWKTKYYSSVLLLLLMSLSLREVFINLIKSRDDGERTTFVTGCLRILSVLQYRKWAKPDAIEDAKGRFFSIVNHLSVCRIVMRWILTLCEPKCNFHAAIFNDHIEMTKLKCTTWNLHLLLMSTAFQFELKEKPKHAPRTAFDYTILRMFKHIACHEWFARVYVSNSF